MDWSRKARRQEGGRPPLPNREPSEKAQNKDLGVHSRLTGEEGRQAGATPLGRHRRIGKPELPKEETLKAGKASKRAGVSPGTEQSAQALSFTPLISHLKEKRIFQEGALPNQQHFSLKNHEYVKAYTIPNSDNLFIAHLDPEKGMVIEEIKVDDPANTPQEVFDLIEKKQTEMKQKFEEFFQSAPLVDEFDPNGGIKSDLNCDMRVEEKGLRCTIRYRHKALGIREETLQLNKVIEKLMELRKEGVEWERILPSIESGRVMVRANLTDDQINDHFSSSTVPLITLDSQFKSVTFYYKDKIDQEIVKLVTIPSNFEKHLYSIETILKYEEKVGKKPPTIQEQLLDHMAKHKMPQGKAVANFERALEKCQTYVHTQCFDFNVQSQRIPKAESQAEGTVWRDHHADYMILGKGIEKKTYKKRFAAGAFKQVSVAVEVHDKLRPRMYAWSTTDVIDTNSRLVTLREVSYLQRIKDMRSDGAKYLLKPVLITGEYAHTSVRGAGIFETKIGRRKIGIMTEYCELGELDHIKGLPVKQRLELFRQVLLGVKALHDEGIVHADLKPENVFLKTSDIGEVEVRVGDFGLAGNFNEKLVRGTPSYMPLELIHSLKSAQQDKEYNSFSTDIYALGLIAYKCVLGKGFASGTFDDFTTMLARKKRNNESVLNISQENQNSSPFLKLIAKMAHSDKSERYSKIDDIISQLDAIMRDEQEIERISQYAKS